MRPEVREKPTSTRRRAAGRPACLRRVGVYVTTRRRALRSDSLCSEPLNVSRTASIHRTGMTKLELAHDTCGVLNAPERELAQITRNHDACRQSVAHALLQKREVGKTGLGKRFRCTSASQIFLSVRAAARVIPGRARSSSRSVTPSFSAICSDDSRILGLRRPEETTR
jgi:hypothetical protein